MQKAPLTKEEWLALEKKANDLRHLCLQTTVWAGSGHIGGGMSVMDILTVMYHRYLNIKKEDPKWEDRDRFILSKGHAGIAYAPVLCDFGWNDMEQLKTFNLTNSKMGIHLDSNKVVGVDASTGSLGHGIPIAAGTAIAARVLGKDYYTYVVTGDGELDEGECWEAFMFASHYKLDNLCIMVDVNGLQIDGTTGQVMNTQPLDDKMDAFGFNTIVCNGNSFADLEQAFILLDRAHGSGKPTCLLMRTTKGLGVSYMENAVEWHGKAPNDAEYEQAMSELRAEYEALEKEIERNNG